jgi:hypothetical protein
MSDQRGLPDGPSENAYTVEVRSENPAAGSAMFRVSVEAGRLVVRQVSVRLGVAGETLQPALAELDFAGLVHAAVSLAGGHVPQGVEVAPSGLSGPGEDVEPPAEPKAGTTTPTPPAVAKRRHRREAAGRRTGPGYNGVPSDIALVYWRLGSVPKVADYYEVSQRTAREWVKGLQKRGSVPNSWK